MAYLLILNYIKVEGNQLKLTSSHLNKYTETHNEINIQIHLCLVDIYFMFYYRKLCIHDVFFFFCFVFLVQNMFVLCSDSVFFPSFCVCTTALIANPNSTPRRCLKTRKLYRDLRLIGHWSDMVRKAVSFISHHQTTVWQQITY